MKEKYVMKESHGIQERHVIVVLDTTIYRCLSFKITDFRIKSENDSLDYMAYRRGVS